MTLIFQDYSLTDLVQALYKGYDTAMAGWVEQVTPRVSELLKRGGLYALNEPIIITFMVFIYIGAKL